MVVGNGFKFRFKGYGTSPDLTLNGGLYYIGNSTEMALNLEIQPILNYSVYGFGGSGRARAIGRQLTHGWQGI